MHSGKERVWFEQISGPAVNIVSLSSKSGNRCETVRLRVALPHGPEA